MLLCIVGVITLVLGCARHRSNPSQDEIRVMLSGAIEEFDPRFVRDINSLRVTRLVHRSLFQLDDNNLKVVSDLAENHHWRSSTELDIQLVEDAYFSNGAQLDANDVVATIQALQSATLGSRFRDTFRKIASADVLSRFRVRITLKKADPTVLSDLEMPILSRHQANQRQTSPLGAGYFVLASRSEQEVVLTRNSHWQGRRARFSTVRFQVVRDANTRAMRLLSGKTDLSVDGVPLVYLPTFEEGNRHEISSTLGVGVRYLGVNLRRKALANRNVRQALSMAIDRRLIVDGLRDGHAVVANGVFSPSHWAKSPAPALRFDPKAARQYLKPLAISLTLRVRAEQDEIALGRALAEMMREVGVHVHLRISPKAILLADLGRGDFDLALMNLPELVEPNTLRWFFHSEKTPERGGVNRWHYQNKVFDRLLDRGLQTMIQEERSLVYQRAEARLRRDLPLIPLFHEEQIYVGRHGLNIRPSARGRFAFLLPASR